MRPVHIQIGSCQLRIEICHGILPWHIAEVNIVHEPVCMNIVFADGDFLSKVILDNMGTGQSHCRSEDMGAFW